MASMAQIADPKPTHALPKGKTISNRYIVIFKPSVANVAQEADNLMRGKGGQIHFRYNNAVKGFAASIPAAALNGIKNNPNVESIEQDATVLLNQTTSPQNQATWGLD